jgi:nucleoside-diphosphate-sugar epimerase
MNVLCTGGTGFCGYWIAKTRPDNVVLAMLDHETYHEAWDHFNWDAIVHLAPISPSRVLKYAQKHKTKVLFASSGAVYEGMGEYAYHKRLWEAECIHSNVDVVVARLFATSGLPFQKNKALSAFVESALKGESIKVWGNGLTVRSYLYGEEVGKWFWKILLDGEGIYDVGSVFPYSMGEIADMVASIVPAKIEFIEHEEMPTPTYYVPKSVQRAAELGCKEVVSLKEVIKRMVKNA